MSISRYMHIITHTHAENLYHHIMIRKYVLDYYGISVIKIDDSYIDECIRHIWNKRRNFIVISEDNNIITKCHNKNLNALIQHVNKSLEATIDYAILLLNRVLIRDTSTNILHHNMYTRNTVPSFSRYNNKMKCSAGVLPIIYHNGEYFAFLGTDKYTKKSSDFGGKFDRLYEWKGNDDILGDRQIKLKNIDPVIMSNYYYTEDDKNKHYVNNVLEYIQSKKLKIAIGDIDTKYTAFREFMEESNYVNPNGKNGYYFDPDTVHKKLYIDHSYMYLGGTQEYNYDMYVLFFVVDDLTPVIKRWFFDSYNKYNDVVTTNTLITSSNDGILNNDILNEIIINNQNCLTIPRNAEICGMKMIPLILLVLPMENIDYNDYIEKKKIIIEMKKKERANKAKDTERKRFFAENYKSPLLDTLRLCFIDALVRYKFEFKYLVSSSGDAELTSMMLKYLSVYK